MNRYKPVGWRNDSYRHSLAARHITTTKRVALAVSDFFRDVKYGVRMQVPSQTKQAEQLAGAAGYNPATTNPMVYNLTDEEKQRQVEAGMKSKWYTPLYDAVTLKPKNGETVSAFVDRVNYSIVSAVNPTSPTDMDILKNPINDKLAPLDVRRQLINEDARGFGQQIFADVLDKTGDRKKAAMAQNVAVRASMEYSPVYYKDLIKMPLTRYGVGDNVSAGADENGKNDYVFDNSRNTFVAPAEFAERRYYGEQPGSKGGVMGIPVGYDSRLLKAGPIERRVIIPAQSLVKQKLVSPVQSFMRSKKPLTQEQVATEIREHGLPGREDI